MCDVKAFVLLHSAVTSITRYQICTALGRFFHTGLRRSPPARPSDKTWHSDKRHTVFFCFFPALACLFAFLINSCASSPGERFSAADASSMAPCWQRVCVCVCACGVWGHPLFCGTDMARLSAKTLAPLLDAHGPGSKSTLTLLHRSPSSSV